ncbi:MAG: hypothetical protein ACKOQM_04000 [Novosphingobium sp.]
MNAALLLFAAQALAAGSPLDATSRGGVRVTAIATVEILSAATTRDEAHDRPITRHRRIGAEGRITLEFE